MHSVPGPALHTSRFVANFVLAAAGASSRKTTLWPKFCESMAARSISAKIDYDLASLEKGRKFLDQKGSAWRPFSA